MVRTLADLVEVAFECDLGRAAIAVRAGRADDGLQRLAETWPRWAAEWRPPPVPEGHLRPFAYNNWKGHDSGGLASGWMDLVGRPDGVDELTQQLLRHLLFCDSVAVPDPFFTSGDGRTYHHRVAGLLADPPAIRTWAAAALDSIQRYRKLIDSDVIVIVPAPAKPRALYQAAAQAIDPSLADQFTPLPSDHWGFGYHHVAAMDIATQLTSAEGMLEPYLPTAGHASTFRNLMRATDETIREVVEDASPDPYSAVLADVLRCPLPEPVRLSVADVAVIRSDGHFRAFRDAFASAVHRFLVQVDNEPEAWPTSAELARRVISEEVRREAERERDSLGWPKNRTVNLAVDVVLAGGTAAAAFLGPIAAAGVAGLEAGKLLAAACARWRFGRGAFARHVAVFSQSARRDR